MTRVLLTGASGFIGTHLTKYLLDKGTVELSTLTRGLNNVEGVSSYYQWEHFDLLNQKFDLIIHLAGKAHNIKNVSSEQEYYDVNVALTKKLFDYFVCSGSGKFIFMSSVKAVADNIDRILDESTPANPETAYGKSKLQAEEYIRANANAENWFILRPCMVHGPDNKGNLNLLYRFVKSGIPYPLREFDNMRSFLSIDNLIYIFDKIIFSNVPAGTYNIADDQSISTNRVVDLIFQTLDKPPAEIRLTKYWVRKIASIGDLLNLPFNSERLEKLTENYIVSNNKIVQAIDSRLPLTIEMGLLKTLRSF